MDLQPTTALLHIQNGTIVSDGYAPGLHALTAPHGAAHGRDRDTLFLHFSLSGQLSETSATLDQLAHLFADQFFRSEGSVTAAIRASITETNQYLINKNLSEADDVRREGSLTCAVLRGQELFMAQVGEAYAYIGHNFGLEPVPNEPPRDVTPFGRTAGLNIRFYHNWLQVEDMLLLGDPRIAHLPNETFVPALVQQNIYTAREQLAAVLQQHSARLVVVEFSDDPNASFLEAKDGAAPTVQFDRDELPARPKFTADTSKADEIRARRRHQVHGPELRPAETAAPEEVTAEQVTRVSEPRPPAAVTQQSAPVTDFNEPIDPIHHETGVDTAYERTRATAPAGEPGPVETRVREGASGFLGTLSGFFRWMAQALTGASNGMGGSSMRRGELSNALIISLAVPLLVAVIGAGTYIQWQNRTQLTTVKTQIAEQLTAARTAPPEQARIHYNNVLALARQSTAITDSDETINRDRADALLNLDILDGVIRLNSSVAYQYNEAVELSSVVIGSNRYPQLYALDSASNVVYKHDAQTDYTALLEGEPTAILSNNDAVGTHITGQILDMHWRDAEESVGRNGLAMLDARGSLISFYPDQADMRAAPLDLAREWQTPSSVVGYNENVYVLDPGTTQIWRYIPNGFGLQINEDNRSIVLDDLDQAIDFAIHEEDGSVVVLYADGRVRRYLSGRLIWDDNILRANGLTTDFSSPTAIKIAANGLRSSIFVLDNGNNRLVEIGFGGNVLAQYKALLPTNDTEVFGSAIDFDIGVSPFRVYVVTGNTVVVAAMPE